MKKPGKVNFIILTIAFIKSLARVNGTARATELYQQCLTLTMHLSQIWLWAKCSTNQDVGQAIRLIITRSLNFIIINSTIREGFGAGFEGNTPYKTENGSCLCIRGGNAHQQVTAPGYEMYYVWLIRHLDGDPWDKTRIYVPEYEWLANAE